MLGVARPFVLVGIGLFILGCDRSLDWYGAVHFLPSVQPRSMAWRRGGYPYLDLQVAVVFTTLVALVADLRAPRAAIITGVSRF